LLEIRNEKNYVGFLSLKIWQILKGFCRDKKLSSKPLFSDECVT